MKHKPPYDIYFEDHPLNHNVKFFCSREIAKDFFNLPLKVQWKELERIFPGEFEMPINEWDKKI